MKAQMSLEMLVYLFLAGISLVYSLIALSGYYGREVQTMSTYKYSNFVESINLALMNGASSLSLYVPSGLCNSTVSGYALRTRYGAFYFSKPVIISKSILCSSGNETANISSSSGYFIVD